MKADQVIRLTDIEDPRLTPYRNLRSGDPNNGTFVAEGMLVVERLITSRHQVQSMVVKEGMEDKYVDRISSDIPIYCLTKAAIESLVGFDFHRGVIACGRREADADVGRLKFDADRPAMALAALGVDDPENMGSLLRSAAAFGINQIVIGPGTIDPFRRRVIRVSMGNALVQRFYRLRDPAAELKTLAESGIRTVASTLAESTSHQQFQHDERPIVLMVGNEAKGIEQQIQDVATDRVRIPMHSGIDSLNVGVAAAIMMYELTERALRSPR